MLKFPEASPQQHREDQGEAGSGCGVGALQTGMGTMSRKLGEDPGSSPPQPGNGLMTGGRTDQEGRGGGTLTLEELVNPFDHCATCTSHTYKQDGWFT